MKQFILSILLIFGATVVSAGSHLPTGGEILQEGRFLHKKEVKVDGEVVMIRLFVMHDENFYLCFVEGTQAHCETRDILPTFDINN